MKESFKAAHFRFSRYYYDFECANMQEYAFDYGLATLICNCC